MSCQQDLVITEQLFKIGEVFLYERFNHNNRNVYRQYACLLRGLN